MRSSLFVETRRFGSFFIQFLHSSHQKVHKNLKNSKKSLKFLAISDRGLQRSNIAAEFRLWLSDCHCRRIYTVWFASHEHNRRMLKDSRCWENWNRHHKPRHLNGLMRWKLWNYWNHRKTLNYWKFLTSSENHKRNEENATNFHTF